MRAEIVSSFRLLSSAFQRGVAQLVEQRSPKPQVAGSSPAAPVRGRSSAVERLLAKEKVVGSSPIARSLKSLVEIGEAL
jgi:hypothetical protein